MNVVNVRISLTVALGVAVAMLAAYLVLRGITNGPPPANIEP